MIAMAKTVTVWDYGIHVRVRSYAIKLCLVVYLIVKHFCTANVVCKKFSKTSFQLLKIYTNKQALFGWGSDWEVETGTGGAGGYKQQWKAAE